jgi:hypothetical protein
MEPSNKIPAALLAELVHILKQEVSGTRFAHQSGELQYKFVSLIP